MLFRSLNEDGTPNTAHSLNPVPFVYVTENKNAKVENGARQLFLSYPELKQELWGGHLWNPSYCAVTVSDRSRDQVMAYIEGQKEKEERK